MAIRVSQSNGWSFDEREQNKALPNEPSNASAMRAFVSDFLIAENVPTHVVDEVLLAVGEVVANACRHGRNPEGGEVLMRCELKDRGIIVTVRDDGPGFDVRSLEVGVPDLLSQGGRGFFLMRQLMDRVKVDSNDGGTTVVLERTLPK